LSASTLYGFLSAYLLSSDIRPDCYIAEGWLKKYGYHLQEKAESVETAAKTVETEHTSEEVANPYQELKEFGLIGYGEGPADLATNSKDYLKEGFGSNRDHR
jgi:hypothetical protein